MIESIVANPMSGLWSLVALFLFVPVAMSRSSKEGAWERSDLGGWRVRFDAKRSTLELEHAGSRARLWGRLAFSSEGDPADPSWSIVLPRDSVGDRLGLADPQGDVQGYVTFRGQGDGALTITAIHRAAQNFEGTMTFQGQAVLGRASFACRTHPPLSSRVVQMASGPADSDLNDSLFDVASDVVMRFAGNTVKIRSEAWREEEPLFDVTLTALIHDSAAASFTVEICPRYYASRWVPNYCPMNRACCPSPPTGWMSWNAYFDAAGEKENLDEARIGAEKLKPFGLEFWHIESWQDNSDQLPVSGFHNLTLLPHPGQFPHGMKWLADRIRELGFRPGIWTVPFGTGDLEFYASHRSWFLHDRDGVPMQNWCGKVVLDPSQKAVREHMEETHRIMSQEWGYEYFKIDGMSGRNPGYSAHFYEREEVRAAFREPCEDPYGLCLQALRRGIGPDRVWLACQGHYTGPEIGLADAGRIGADIVHANHPPDWSNYLNQARTTLNQLFVNNIVWYNDPDTLMVGPANPMNVVRVATTVVGLPGQVMFAGDKLAELSPERMRLLQICLPVCDVRPLDLFPIFEMAPVWDLKIRREFGAWDVVSLFNWGEGPESLEVRFPELGLPGDQTYLAYDFWNQAFLGAFRDAIRVEVPPHGNRLIAMHRSQGHPQVLSTHRHITQGGVELESVRWDEGERTLSGVVRLVSNVDLELVVFEPEGYRHQTVQVGDEVAASARTVEDSLLILSMRHSDSGSQPWRLTFSSGRAEGS